MAKNLQIFKLDCVLKIQSSTSFLILYEILAFFGIIIAKVGNTAQNTQPSHNANKTVPSLVRGKISFQTLPHLSPEDDVS